MALPEAGNLVLAGGGAMLAHDLVDRPTRDVDLFSSDPTDIDRVAGALAAALRVSGDMVEVQRRGDTFTRLVVGPEASPDAVTVELAFDARMRPSVAMGFGRVLDRDELAADKTLALFGRAQARDLVDAGALLDHGYTRSRLLQLAAEKDSGFDVIVFRAALSAASARPDVDFTGLGLSAGAISALRSLAADWRAELGEAS
jgi:hypothetical protein